MDDDYGEQVRRGLVHVAEDGGGEIVGLIVLVESEDRLVIENVAVDPARQGEGIGRRLLEFAEETARRAGIDTVALYTHEKMSREPRPLRPPRLRGGRTPPRTAFARAFSRVVP